MDDSRDLENVGISKSGLCRSGITARQGPWFARSVWEQLGCCRPPQNSQLSPSVSITFK